MNKARLLLMVALLGVGLSAWGEIAISILDIEPGVRTVGMGGAAVALVPSAETLYYNAAGLSELPGISFSSFYASHLGAASYTAMDLTVRNVGIGVLMVSSGSIPGYDDEGNSTEDLSYGSTAFLLGFGFGSSQLPFLPALPLDFSIGGRIKGLSVTCGTEKGAGFALDLAYQMRFADLSFGPVGLSDVGFGLTVTNLIGSIGYSDRSESFPMDLRLGGAARIANIVLVAADLELAGRAHLGVEVQAVEALAVRVGILSQAGGISLSFGAGFGMEGLHLDYAYLTHPSLGGSHRISLTIDFGGLNLAGIGRALRNLLP